MGYHIAVEIFIYMDGYRENYAELNELDGE